MLWRHRVAVFVAVLATSGSSALAQGAATDPVPGSSTITIENASSRLILSPDGEIQSLHLPVNLLPEQYLETGDPWVSRDPGLCRVFDADGNELKRIKLGPSQSLESGPVSLRLCAEGSPTARAKVTLLLEGTADGQKAPPKRSESDQ